VLTEAPLEALDLPLAAIALVAALRAALAVAEALLLVLELVLDDLVVAAFPVVVPLGACVVCEPLAEPPAALT
jgi:hypothetical protein